MDVAWHGVNTLSENKMSTDMSRTWLKGVLISLWLVLDLTVGLSTILASSDETERWAKAGSVSHSILGLVPAAQEVRQGLKCTEASQIPATSTHHSCSNPPASPHSVGGRKHRLSAYSVGGRKWQLPHSLGYWLRPVGLMHLKASCGKRK